MSFITVNNADQVAIGIAGAIIARGWELVIGVYRVEQVTDLAS
jgi:hypothetical protein